MNPLPTLAVANWFLAKSPDSTAMKLQRLTYFSHCWCLALYNVPLVDEFVTALPWAPVFMSIYDAARPYGKGVVTDLLPAPSVIDPQDPRVPLLSRIWDVYGGYTYTQLSRLATEENGPWHTTIQKNKGRKNPHIDENDITSFYKGLVS